MNPADLIQELRDAARVTAWHEKRLEADLYRRAADTLASKDTALAEMRVENDRLRKALKPFAEAQGHFDGHVRDDDIVDVALRNIRAHHIRAASRALSQDGEERS